jgi:hypothetical protein
MAAAPQQAQGSAGIPICGGFDFLFLLLLLLPLLVIGVGVGARIPPRSGARIRRAWGSISAVVAGGIRAGVGGRTALFRFLGQDWFGRPPRSRSLPAVAGSEHAFSRVGWRRRREARGAEVAVGFGRAGCGCAPRPA